MMAQGKLSVGALVPASKKKRRLVGKKKKAPATDGTSKSYSKSNISQATSKIRMGKNSNNISSDSDIELKSILRRPKSCSYAGGDDEINRQQQQQQQHQQQSAAPPDPSQQHQKHKSAAQLTTARTLQDDDIAAAAAVAAAAASVAMSGQPTGDFFKNRLNGCGKGDNDVGAGKDYNNGDLYAGGGYSDRSGNMH